jgi:hypothetical protein
MKRIKYKFLALVVLFSFASCELDLLDNPNAVSPNNADINLLLNRLAVDYSGHFNGFSDSDMRLTRMLNQGAAIYDNAITPSGQNGNWTQAYANLLVDAKSIIELGDKSNLFVHAGIGRTIRAAVLLNMVDHYGDIPFSETGDPTNFNPKTDDGQSVYNAALKDLNDALANFAANSLSNGSDLFFGGNKDRWTRVANTLKLKANLNLKMVDRAKATSEINALIAGGKLITANADNFVFRFGTNLNNPDNRHPRYAGGYLPTGGGDYMSNSYMGEMHNRKGFEDPRIRYYFYRPVIKNSTNVNEIRCIGVSKPTHYSESDYFCYPTAVGYWGRDHLSNEGIPPDNLLRTQWGLYPAGGLYDQGTGGNVGIGLGAGGAGVHPILTASFTHFMLAEAALTLGTTGDAAKYLEDGIKLSMDYVRAYSMATTEAGKITASEAARGFVWNDEVTKYINFVKDAYTNASSNDAKMDIIAREYQYAAWGNGTEIYNLYRRTGFPSKLQPGLDANVGPFVRSFYYPLNFIIANTNAKQKSNAAVQVFWDKNPAGFIK